MTSGPRHEVVRYWWSKAEESLASARRELEAGSHLFAVNRLYYAAFYDRLYEDRQEGDSVALVSFDREYVESQVGRCARFLSELRPLVSHLSRE